MELLYSRECPYCRKAAWVVNVVDVTGAVETVALESEEGTKMVIDHHGEYLHAPHLFTDSLVYYGVGPTAKALGKRLVTETARNILP